MARPTIGRIVFGTPEPQFVLPLRLTTPLQSPSGERCRGCGVWVYARQVHICRKEN